MADKEAMSAPKKLLLILLTLVVALGVGYFASFTVMKNDKGLKEYTHSTHLEVMRESNQTVEKLGLKIFMSSAMGVCAAAMCIIVLYSTQSQVIKDLHGSASWAKLEDIKKAQLLDGKGLYVGGYQSNKTIHHLRDDSNTHLLAFAPTRSGKGVSLILPTLLTNHEKSFFCYDIKGENFALSAGWRKLAGNRIIKLELASSESHRYNPLDEIDYDSPTFIQDVQNLSQILTASGDPKKDQFDHWISKARNVLTGLIIYAKEDPSRTANLYEIGNLLTDSEKDQEETIAHLLETTQHRDAKFIFTSLANTPEKERGSIISTLEKSFELFRDPIVRENTSTSDFTINDLVNGDEPCSLYFIVQPNDLDRLSTMVRVFVTQLLNKLICGMEFEGGTSQQKNKHQLILMLDEFASMRYMPVVEEGLAFIAGYGVRAYLIVQDLDQIHKYYGRENGVIGNCHTQIAFAPNTNNTAEYLSKQLGKQTIIRKKVSKTTGGKTSKNYSKEEVGRDLLTPDETRRLQMIDLENKSHKGGETLIMQSGKKPIKGTRILYFLNETFQARSKIPAPKSYELTGFRAKRVS
jgi:type IV secretion system protein VirD4